MSAAWEDLAGFERDLRAQALSRSAMWATILRPRLFIDGDQWCALYGDNLQEGVAGFGTTPEFALENFDAQMSTPLRTQATS